MTTSMNLTRATLAALALIAPAQGQTETPAAKLERLTSGMTPQVTESEAELRERVVRLSRDADLTTLRAIGESAGPPIADLARPLPLTELLSNALDNPLAQLIQVAPSSTVDFYDQLQREDPVRYEQLQRSEFALPVVLEDDFAERLSLEGQGQLGRLAERTLDMEGVPMSARIEFAGMLLSPFFQSERAFDFLMSAAPESSSARAALRNALEVELMPLDADQVLSIAREVLKQPRLSEDGVYLLQQRVIEKLFKLPPQSAERAEAVLGFRELFPMNDLWVDAFSDTSIATDRLGRPVVRPSRLFAALPKEWIPEALEVIAHSGLQGGDRGRVMRNSEAWAMGDARDLMEASLADGSLSPMTRLVAAHGLLVADAGEKATVDRVADVIAAMASDPATLPRLIEALPEVQMISDDRAIIWTQVTSRLMGDTRIPDALADVLVLWIKVDAPGGRALIDDIFGTAAKRLETAKTPMTFHYLRSFGLRAMADDPTLIQPQLVNHWLALGWDSTTGYRSFVRLANAANDSTLTARVAQDLESAIRAADNTFERKSGADLLLRLDNADAVPRLIALAVASDDLEFTAHVEMIVTRTLNLRRAAAEWRTLASGGDTRGEATAKVLALLDSPNRDVRIEAIHGLGTLGAVETLPRLIELVASEDQGIKEAAVASLKRLRERPVPAKTD